jgi:SAM-dependent methyltransferase
MSATNSVHVDPSNAEQLHAWDGDEGAYWADNAEYFERALAAYHDPFFAAAPIGTADRVLDVGCGTGLTTRDAARRSLSGSVLGVDLSSRMIEHARTRATAEGIGNVSFEQADAQIHPFEPGTFDVAISQTGAMFFGDLTAAFVNIRRALRPGGRLVLLSWQPLASNAWVRELTGALAAGRDLPAPPPGAPGPFSLDDPERVRAILEAAGFSEIERRGMTAGMWFGHDADDAYRFVLGLLGWMLDGLDDAGRGRALDALRSTVTAHETDGGVIYESAAWIIRATRV